MKRTALFLIFTFALTVGAVASLPELSASAESSTVSSGVSWIDDFSNSTLDARWSWSQEDPTHWSLTAQPGIMRITTQTGGIFGHYYAVEKNILLADAPTENFQITTKVNINLSQDVQTAGILYFKDHDNYLNLVYVHDHGKWVSFHKEVGGTPSYSFYPDQVLTSTLYLRIVRLGDDFVGFFSTDGDNWTLVGSQTITLADPKVGVAACNGPSGVTEIPADFDFFQLSINSHIYLPLIIK